MIQFFQFHHGMVDHVIGDVVRLDPHILCVEAVFDECFRMGRIDADIGQAVGKVDGSGKGVDFISFLNLTVHGEHDLQAVVDHGTVRLFSLMRHLGIAVVNGVGQAGVQVVLDAYGSHAGSDDDGEDGRFQIGGDDALIDSVESGLAVFQDTVLDVLRIVDAGFLYPGKLHAPGGEGNLILLGERVALTGPEILPRCMGNDFRIDEGVVSVAFPVHGAFEGMVRVVHDAHRCDGSAVRCQGGEGEDRLVQQVGRPLGGVRCPSAADGKNHIGFLNFRNLRESFRIFKGGVIAVEVGAENFNVSFADLADGGLSGGSGFVASDDDGGLSVIAADFRNGVIGVGADGKMREKCAVHGMPRFLFFMK